MADQLPGSPARTTPPIDKRSLLDTMFPVDPREVAGGLYSLGTQGVGNAVGWGAGKLGVPNPDLLGRDVTAMLDEPRGGLAHNPELAAAPLAVGARRLKKGGKAAEEADVASTLAARSEPPGQPGTGVPNIPGAPAPGSVADTIAQRSAPKNMQQVPDIRGLPVEQGIAAARTGEHIIPLPGGGFVGAPRSLRTMDDIYAERAAFDKYVDEETSGWDWYNRYRKGANDLVGGDPAKNEAMSNLQGQWSAGTDPQGEIGRVIKETTGAVTGNPAQAGFPAQHEAFMRAVEENDPSNLQLGRKTGQYAARIKAFQPVTTATGVNDFRYANQRGFLPEEGSTTRDGDISLTEAQHRWLDHETALAVDRANQRQLLGRTDWTGEEIQAMPWVRQKAEALAAKGAQQPYPLSNYQSGLTEAMKTAPDYAPGFRANATFEPQPGENIAGHLEDASKMTPDERLQYARFVDPKTGYGSSMTDASGRDVLYGGQQVYGGPNVDQPTGYAPYVMPTRPMQGFYPNNEGLTETNPGYAASPLVTPDVGPKTGRLPAEGPPQESGAPAFSEREYPKVKTLSPASEEMMRTAEYVRSVQNSQQSGAGNISFTNPVPPVGVTQGFHIPMNRPATPEELAAHQAVGTQFGLPHVTDSGSGITVTNFDTSFDPNAQPVWTPKSRQDFVTKMNAITPADAAGPGAWAKTDSIYEPIDWNAREPGKGQISQEMINRITKNPQTEASWANNPNLPPQTQANAARYEAFKDKTGATAPDIWNTQQLMGQGPDWINQMRDILSGKAKIPAATAAGTALFPAAGLAAPDQQQRPPPIGSSPQFDDWWKLLQAQRFSGQDQAPQ